jgi:hypothetical protein
VVRDLNVVEGVAEHEVEPLRRGHPAQDVPGVRVPRLDPGSSTQAEARAHDARHLGIDLGHEHRRAAARHDLEHK